MVLPIEIDDRVDGITYRVDDITYDITLMRLKVDDITYRNWWYMTEMWKYMKDDIKQKGRVWVIYGILPGEVMKKIWWSWWYNWDLRHNIYIYIFIQYMEGYIIMISGICLIGDTIRKNRVAPTH